METQYEFGQATRELEVARTLKRKKITRRAMSVGLGIVLATLIFAFRNNIQEVFASGSNTNETTLLAGTKQDKKGKAASNVSITRQWDLPAELLEISALSWLDENHLACVQDELGVIFIYNLATSSVERKISFGGPGDYEGLAIIGKDAWVLRSDGQLFEVASFTGQPVVKEYNTHLTAAHNTEGLCYDEKNNRLLVALKDGEPGGGDQKGIYSFDLSTKKMQELPVMKLDMKRLFAGVTLESKKKKDKAVFMPSAISIHPSTGDIYILEGRNPRLLILGESGDVKKFHTLDKSDFNQPEGITFSPSGDMYISNEGTKKPGNILKVRL